MCFVPLLPPKDAPNTEAPADPLTAQLGHVPHPASVVALGELLAPKPGHQVRLPVMALLTCSPEAPVCG